jgi:hypothetical protein
VILLTISGEGGVLKNDENSALGSADMLQLDCMEKEELGIILEV